MTTKVIALIALFLAAGATAAHAGYDGYIPGEGAAQYSGGCTAAGAVDGRTVPRCATGEDGSFSLIGPFMSAATAGTMAIKNIDFVNVSSAATGNKCFFASCAIEEEGIALNGGTGGANTTTFSKSIANCASGPKFCSTAASSTVTCGGAASGCSGTRCNNHRARITITVVSEGSGCTSEAATAIDIPFVAITVQ